ncbi:MAG: ATP-binding cassette domain-containing protein, partial [Acidimicrobiia bacterium]
MGRGRLTEIPPACSVDRVPEALKASGISKRFGATRALEHLDIIVAAGEVHALVGENGSGKSTFIRILAGYHAPDPGGHLEVGGRPVRFPLRPGAPRQLGMSFVHQDLGLIPSLSVLENLRLGDLATRRGLRVDWRREVREAEETLARYELGFDPSTRVADLDPRERALLAIVRAVEDLPTAGPKASPPGLLVLDEPSVFLPRVESERFGRLMRNVAASGAGVLFVSHDLDEVLRRADRVTVLRNGRARPTVPRDQAAAGDLAELMTGRR